MLLHVMTLSKVLSGNFIRYTGNKEPDYLTEEGNFVKFKYCQVYEYSDGNSNKYYTNITSTDVLQTGCITTSNEGSSTYDCSVQLTTFTDLSGYYLKCPNIEHDAQTNNVIYSKYEADEQISVGYYTSTKPQLVYTEDQIKTVIAANQNDNEESYSLIEPISKKLQTIDVMRAKDLELAPLDIVQPIVEKDDKAFFFASCVAFWVAFVLIVATFIMAILGVSSCCNSVNVIFPRRK